MHAADLPRAPKQQPDVHVHRVQAFGSSMHVPEDDVSAILACAQSCASSCKPDESHAGRAQCKACTALRALDDAAQKAHNACAISPNHLADSSTLSAMTELQSLCLPYLHHTLNRRLAAALRPLPLTGLSMMIDGPEDGADTEKLVQAVAAIVTMLHQLDLASFTSAASSCQACQNLPLQGPSFGDSFVFRGQGLHLDV